MILPDQINLAEIAFYMHQLDEELEIQSRIVKARALDDGFFDEDLAIKTQQYLVGGDASELEGINLMSIVLRTILRRIDVAGLSCEDETVQEWANGVWDANQLDAKQGDVHRGAERDGEFFVIVDWDRTAPRPWEEGEEVGAPVFYLHERYTSAEATYGEEVGSNTGCKAHYRNDDPNQPLDMVSKRWIETNWVDGEAVTTQRLTLYIAQQNETPARIEKYLMDGDEFAQHQDEYIDEAGTLQTEEWPIWWTDDLTENGLSMPLPVVHFRNEEMRPISFRLWGMQNGMDHAWSSLLSGVTITAHQIFTAFGFWPTTDGNPPEDDGSNLIKIGARTIIGNADTSPTEASFNALEPGNLLPIIDAMDKIAIYCSFVAGLPINNFVVSKQVAGSGTLRQGEADLVGHVNALWRLFGHSWSQCFEIARRLEAHSAFGANEMAMARVTPLWAPAETVNIEAVIAEAVAQTQTNIPWQIVAQTKWGYTQEEVTQMEQMLSEAGVIGDDSGAAAGDNGEEKANADDADSPDES